MPIIRPIIRQIHFDPIDYRLVRDLAKANGLERDSLSAALHWIIREWFAMRIQVDSAPAPQVYPMTSLQDEIARIKAELARKAGG
jgi:hypothetical protein